MSLNQILPQGKQGAGLNIDVNTIVSSGDLYITCDNESQILLKTATQGNIDDVLTSNADGTVQWKPAGGGGSGLTNPLTENIIGDGYDIQNIGKLTINQTSPFQTVLEVLGKTLHSSPNTVISAVNSDKIGGVTAGSIIGITNFSAFDNTNTSFNVGSTAFRSNSNQTATNKGSDYIVKSTLTNETIPEERLKISADGTTYITGGLDLTDDLKMNNNNIVDIGPQNYNLETSLLDLTARTQNIESIPLNTQITGQTSVVLGVTDNFQVRDDTSPFSLLKFRINNTDILSQITHIFSNGLETSLNGIGSIGTALKRFSGLWVDNINGLTPVGGLYSGLSDGALVQAGFLGSLLPATGTPLNGLTIPANGFKAGDSFHLVIAGDIPIGDNADDLTIRLKQNTVTLASIDIAMENSTNTFFECECDFQIRSIGVTGEIITNFDFTFNKTLTKDFKGTRKVDASIINTTVQSSLTIEAQFTGAFNSTMRTKLFYLTKTF